MPNVGSGYATASPGSQNARIAESMTSSEPQPVRCCRLARRAAGELRAQLRGVWLRVARDRRSGRRRAARPHRRRGSEQVRVVAQVRRRTGAGRGSYGVDRGRHRAANGAAVCPAPRGRAHRALSRQRRSASCRRLAGAGSRAGSAAQRVAGQALRVGEWRSACASARRPGRQLLVRGPAQEIEHVDRPAYARARPAVGSTWLAPVM
jgi:hypothetical protein